MRGPSADSNTAAHIIRYIEDYSLFGEDVQCAHKKVSFKQEEETDDAGKLDTVINNYIPCLIQNNKLQNNRYTTKPHSESVSHCNQLPYKNKMK